MSATDGRFTLHDKMKEMPTTTSTRVLVVDDDTKQRDALAEMVASLGFKAATASNGREALEAQANQPADIILTDLIMPQMDGFELLRTLEERGDRTPTIVLTGFGSIEKAISVVHDLKAFWFLEKPVQPSILRALIDRAGAQNRLLAETEVLNRQLSFHGFLGDLVGNSRAMRQVFSEIQQVAPTSASVLITGESGTGKELVARAVHRLSPRSAGPFVPVNCAAFMETLIESELFGHEKGSFTGALERHAGCFEQANNGTVFLDEIGDMPIGTQAKLLRVLEDRKVRRLGGKVDIPVEVRVVAATNRVPEEAIRSKLLREDLYYRLNVFHIFLPPLRDRKEDIPPISEAILSTLNKKHGTRIAGLHPAALERFQNYNWPGNIRELRNILERAAIMAGEGLIMPKHFASDTLGFAGAGEPEVQAATAPPPASEPEEGESIRIRPGATMEEIEDAYINLILQRTNNNKTKAADILGISVRTLHNRLGQLGNKKLSNATGA
jgi:DNA-binding NtrC family response regulator